MVVTTLAARAARWFFPAVDRVRVVDASPRDPATEGGVALSSRFWSCVAGLEPWFMQHWSRKVAFYGVVWVLFTIGMMLEAFSRERSLVQRGACILFGWLLAIIYAVSYRPGDLAREQADRALEQESAEAGFLSR